MKHEPGSDAVLSGVPGPATDERVSTLVGDRLCIGCGFNFAGQPVVREPHYRMLIVRCPECGTVASLQEFPVLGKWALRWGSIIAAAWLLAMLLLMLGTAGAIFGMSVGVSTAASSPLTEYLSKEHSGWSKSKREEQNTAQIRKAQATVEVAEAALELAKMASSADPETDGSAEEVSRAQMELDRAKQQLSAIELTIGQQEQWQTYYDANWIATEWLEAQDLDAILSRARAGGFTYSARAAKLWIILAIIAAILGVIWGVAVPNARAKRMAFICVIVLALVAAMGAIWRAGSVGSTTFIGATQMEIATEVSARLVGLKPFVLSVTLGVVPLWLGMLAGRPIARFMIRMLLAPRQRGALASLWIADGLPPPGVR